MGICCTNTHACVCPWVCLCVLLTSQMTPEKGLNLIKVFCLFTVDNSRVRVAPAKRILCHCLHNSTRCRLTSLSLSLSVWVCVRDGVCVDMTVSNSSKREVRGRRGERRRGSWCHKCVHVALLVLTVNICAFNSQSLLTSDNLSSC